MTTLIEQPAFSKSEANLFAEIGTRMDVAWQALGLWGRRAVLTVAGAVFALGCGGAVAGVLRLPVDMKDAAQPDEMTVQDELPSAVAARTYALENPPPYPVAKTDADAVSDAIPVIAIDDASLTRTAYTGPTDDDQDKTDTSDQDRDRSTATPGAATPASTDARN